MNTSLPPLPADQVDQLLSAELDGEFDAAAVDLGFTPADARMRLDATPGVDARRTALASARDALATVPELDEVMSARLRAKAMKAGTEELESRGAERTRKRYRVLSAVAGIAAALVILVGAGVALNNNSSSDKQSNSSSDKQSNSSAAVAGGAPVDRSTATPSAKSATIDYGDAPDANALAQSVLGKLSATKATSALAAGGASTPRSLSDESASADSASCDGAARGFSGVNTAPVKTGNARIAGNPVLVYGFPKGATHVVVVVTPDCKLVIQQVAPTPAP